MIRDNDPLANKINNGMVRTLPETQSDTLIYGAMYEQQRHYAFVKIASIKPLTKTRFTEKS